MSLKKELGSYFVYRKFYDYFETYFVSFALFTPLLAGSQHPTFGFNLLSLARSAVSIFDVHLH